MSDESNRQQILINIGSLFGNVEHQTIVNNHPVKAADAKEANSKESRNQHYSLTVEQQAAFSRAEEAGYMTSQGYGKYKWLGQKVSLAYFIGRLFCGDYVEYRGKITIWKVGDNFPSQTMTAMFGYSDLGTIRSNRKDGNPPRDYRDIDRFVEG